MRLPHHLIRHPSGVWYFRQSVPPDLRKVFGVRVFIENPKGVLEWALALAETDTQTITEYETDLLPLIYGNIQPSFKEAFASFKLVAEELISTLP